MPRYKKQFPDADSYNQQIADYCLEHRAELQAELLRQTGCKTMEELQDKEYHMGWGLDCGWMMMCPKNPDMLKEWKREQNFYSGGCRLKGIDKAYLTQSTTLQSIIAEKVWEALKLGDILTYFDHLD